ncbi:MAG: HlyD family type I secretion periplasmic adaptor subunit [Bacteroidetes bacterium]|nr:HlyD family type I secretion periplasmic adaptor subunit [Bacteroidota bacterium]
MNKTSQARKPNLNFNRPMVFGLLAFVILAGGSLAWSMTAKVSGAVIATGSVVVEGKPKSVQHLDGGLIAKIHISSGDRVKRDQVLMELDDTSIRANLAIYEGRLREALVKQSRLRAELEDKETFEAPREQINALDLGNFESSVKQQAAMMNARRSTLDAQLAGQDERISQFQSQIKGVEGLIGEKRIQISGYDEEIWATKVLVEKKLTARSKLIALERAMSDMRGQIAEHHAEVARVENSISETKITKLQLNREFMEKVITEIEDIQTRTEELGQQLYATRKQLSRVEIRAPVSGIVHELTLHTISGVVQPGQVLMQIIEQKGQFEIELNIDTVSVDQVFEGQGVIIRFPAFHQRTTPELDGVIKSISPSSVVDEKTGIAFYRAAVELPAVELEKLGDKKLIPGMPVEGFIATEERTVLTYLTKPITDNLIHVFREE